MRPEYSPNNHPELPSNIVNALGVPVATVPFAYYDDGTPFVLAFIGDTGPRWTCWPTRTTSNKRPRPASHPTWWKDARDDAVRIGPGGGAEDGFQKAWALQHLFQDTFPAVATLETVERSPNVWTRVPMEPVGSCQALTTVVSSLEKQADPREAGRAPRGRLRFSTSGPSDSWAIGYVRSSLAWFRWKLRSLAKAATSMARHQDP